MKKIATRKNIFLFILFLNVTALILYAIELHFDVIKQADKDNYVPNIVHIMLLDQSNIQFYQFVNIYSIYFNQKPSQIYIHCNKCSFNGRYLNELKKNNEIWNKIKFKKVDSNKKEESFIKFEILSEHGGIFVDKKVYMVKSLQKYFNNEMILAGNFSLGNSVMIAKKNSKFLKKFNEFLKNENSLDIEKLIELNQDLIKRTNLIGKVYLLNY